jgi:hypothetical protein
VFEATSEARIGCLWMTLGRPQLPSPRQTTVSVAMVRIVVDGANVVGSRPDGWWRDRAGAASRLAEQLHRLSASDPDLEIVLVLEGAARSGRPAGRDGSLEVVHASGSGDDEIVRQSEAADVVVTADRELRQRVSPVASQGPSWLLSQLPSP